MDHTRQSTLFTSVVLLMNILVLWAVIIMLNVRLSDSQKKVEDLQAQIVAIEGEVILNLKEAGRTTCAPDCSCQDMGEVDVQTEETVAPSEPEIITHAYEVPQQSSFKSYTFYTSLSRSSKQWRIQEMAYTDELGFRRVNDAYCVMDGSCDDIKPLVWIHGHSHSRCDITIDGVRYIRNPIGYRSHYGYVPSEVIPDHWYDTVIEV